MIKWKHLFYTAAVCSMVAASPLYAQAKLSDYDAETAAKLQDNTLEYGELENLIKEYNPQIKYSYDQLYYSENASAATVRGVKNDIENNDYKGQLKNLRDAKKALEAAPDSPQKAEGLKNLNTAISGIEQILSVPASTSKSTKKQIESAEKQIATGARQVLMGVQKLMVGYDNLSAQVNTLSKMEELQKESVEAAKLQAGLGMATQTSVLSAESSLLATQTKLQSLRSTAGDLRSQLCLLTGWAADATPEIGAVPSADTTKIAAIDLQTDIRTAIGNNQTLISQRHSSSKKSTVAIDNRLMNIDEAEQKLTIEMNRLYQAIQQKKVANDAAETAYQKALITKDAAERQYKLGMMSQLQYLGSEVQFYQAEGARKAADTNLLQAMLDYDWAVQGFVSIPN